MQFELNDGLAQHVIKKGDPGRNKLGVQGTPQLRRSYREFRQELGHVSTLPCCAHDHDPPMSLAECLARDLWIRAVHGERWAAHLLLNRWLGRVAFEVEIRKPEENPYMVMSKEDMLTQLDKLRATLAEDVRATQVIDVGSSK
jgi:hypothetical protein